MKIFELFGLRHKLILSDIIRVNKDLAPSLLYNQNTHIIMKDFASKVSKAWLPSCVCTTTHYLNNISNLSVVNTFCNSISTKETDIDFHHFMSTHLFRRIKDYSEEYYVELTSLPTRWDEYAFLSNKKYGDFYKEDKLKFPILLNEKYEPYDRIGISIKFGKDGLLIESKHLYLSYLNDSKENMDNIINRVIMARIDLKGH